MVNDVARKVKDCELDIVDLWERCNQWDNWVPPGEADVSGPPRDWERPVTSSHNCIPKAEEETRTVEDRGRGRELGSNDRGRKVRYRRSSSYETQATSCDTQIRTNL